MKYMSIWINEGKFILYFSNGDIWYTKPISHNVRLGELIYRFYDSHKYNIRPFLGDAVGVTIEKGR